MNKILLITILFIFIIPSSFAFPFRNIFQKILSFNKSILKVDKKSTYKNKIIYSLNSSFLKLTLEVTFIDSDNLRILITDNLPKRYEMPDKDPFPHFSKEYTLSQMNLYFLSSLNYRIDVKESPFSLYVYLKSTNEKIFSIDAMNFPFIFTKTLLDFTVSVPSKYIFGLGERSFDFKLREGIYTLYNRDQYGVEENGKGGKNRYGSHPMYLVKDKNNNYHVNYLRNPLPMDVIIKEDSINKSYNLNYKVIGGVIDFHLFTGDKFPETAVKAYHKYLGGFSLPPFWSMGWHQCRWGYRDLFTLKDVLKNYHKYKVPLDTLWMDIDYMKDYMPFTLDKSRYNLKEFHEMLSQYKKKFVMIMEPAISLKSRSEEHLRQGRDQGIFIKNSKGKNLISRVWPGNVHFIDYFNPKAHDFWKNSLSNFHKTINFSGIWLDMNEIATFVDGQILLDQFNNEINYYQDICFDKTDYKYLPGNTKLQRNTICPNSIHYNNIAHVNLHNYYPVQQAMITYNFLRELNKNEYPFILTRANAPGMGKYSAHWTGDNYSTYKFLKYSLQESMNSNLFGMPMVGADICGFGGQVNESLCARWMQLGTLYPFARSHAHNDSNRKEFWQFGDLMINTSILTIKFRYRLLKFYYSLFIRSNKHGTIFRPLFFEFPSDMNILDNNEIMNSQVMIYDSLMLAPNLTEIDTITVYFPLGIWYDLRNFSKVEKNGLHVVNAGLNEIAPLFLRGGKTIFLQNVDNVENSYDLDQNFDLIIGLGNDNNNKMDSIGYLPALNDYNNMKNVEDCINYDCMFKIVTVFVKEFNEVNLKIAKPKFQNKDFLGVSITKIYILGLNISEQDFKSINTNIDKFIEISEKEKSKYIFNLINQNAFEVVLNGKIDIQGELDIFFKFYNY